MPGQGPTLLCSTGPLFRLPLTRAVAAIADAGYDAIEVMVTGERDTQNAVTLSRLAADHGVRIGTVHAPFLLITRRVFTSDPLEKIRRSVALAQEVGAPTVVVHPPYRWQFRYANWLDEDLEDFSAREQVTVAVENMFPVRLRRQALTFHNTVGIEEMRRYPTVCLDTSHLAVAGIDILQAYDELPDRIRHIHLSNNLGTGRDTHSPLREGVLPVGRFLERLGATGFSGSITLELDLRPWADKPGRLAAVLRENRSYCLERLGAAAGA